MQMSPYNIGMVGGGVVGGGVYNILEQKWGSLCRVTKICVRDLEKPREFKLANHTKLVADPNAILEDENIACVVEVMGGTTVAKDIVYRALSKGKHVVTANKALLAQFLPEIQALLQQHPSSRLAYEAAVCGGIPIIRTMQQDFVGDDIRSVSGICNGTTNFMLSKMEEEGANYAEVLAEAQALGYAEADPTADVEGHDAQAKIALLAKLAFGQNIPFDNVPTTGISSITSGDFKEAARMQKTIKLLGTAARTDAGGVSVYVSPVLVPLNHPLATARGSGNMVVVESKNLGLSSYAGPGAGRYPTANSVVNDIVRNAKDICSPPFPLEASVNLERDYVAKFYVRCGSEAATPLLFEVTAAAERYGIQISSATQKFGQGIGCVCTILTETSSYSIVQKMCNSLSWRAGKPLIMSMLEE